MYVVLKPLFVFPCSRCRRTGHRTLTATPTASTFPWRRSTRIKTASSRPLVTPRGRGRRTPSTTTSARCEGPRLGSDDVPFRPQGLEEEKDRSWFLRSALQQAEPTGDELRTGSEVRRNRLLLTRRRNDGRLSLVHSDWIRTEPEPERSQGLGFDSWRWISQGTSRFPKQCWILDVKLYRIVCCRDGHLTSLLWSDWLTLNKTKCSSSLDFLCMLACSDWLHLKPLCFICSSCRWFPWCRVNKALKELWDSNRRISQQEIQSDCSCRTTGGLFSMCSTFLCEIHHHFISIMHRNSKHAHGGSFTALNEK